MTKAELKNEGISMKAEIVPHAELVQTAADSGTALMVSPVGMFQTCGRLYQCLHGDGQEGA